MESQVGMILEGKVKSITNFGAFVTLEGGRSGLVHISEIANTYVNDVNDHLTVGQTVKVMVLSCENGKINLSIKRTEPAPSRPQRRTEGRNDAPQRRSEHWEAAPRHTPGPPVPQEQTFEDKLKKFLSSSEGKMADLNRSMDNRRGKRRK